MKLAVLKSASPIKQRMPRRHGTVDVETALSRTRTGGAGSPVLIAKKLRCCDVRWFYREQKDTGKWTPFKGADSMKLELHWRRVHGVSVDEYSLRDLSKKRRASVLKAEVAVLDGLFEVSADFQTVHNIFWKGDELDVRRGSWFSAESLQPLECKVADAIEEHHVKWFGPKANRYRAKAEEEYKRTGVITTLLIRSHYEVKWKAANKVALYNLSRLRYLPTGRKSSTLMRGYNVRCDWDDGELIVKHLVLVIHGIGQKQTCSISQMTSNLRANVNAVFEKRFEGERKCPMVLPVDWRASLALDRGLTEAASLPKIWELREFCNLTLMDIMYYQSPRYRTELITGLLKALNATFALFLRHFPDFNGRVSLFAHSLGSVMCYDLLTGYSPMAVYERLITRKIKENIEKSDKPNEQLVKLRTAREKFFGEFGREQEFLLDAQAETLEFQVKNLFCVGSPLAIFLIMRGEDDAVISPSLRVKRLYNIFHPYDPVAYRLEPLNHREYQKIKPIKLRSSTDEKAMLGYDHIVPQLWQTYFKSKLKREKKKAAEKAAEKDSSASPNTTDDDTATTDSFVSSPPTPRTAVVSDAVTGPNVAPEKVLQEIPKERRLKYRLDYQVQPQMTEVSYVSMFSSHSSYWYNVDVAAFLVGQLYQKRKPPRQKTVLP